MFSIIQEKSVVQISRYIVKCRIMYVLRGHARILYNHALDRYQDLTQF